MDVELQINNSVDPRARFLTWAPSPCRIRVTNPSGVTSPQVDVELTSQSGANGGAVLFRAAQTDPFSASITLSVPINGSSVSFFAAGEFGMPSSANADVTVQAKTNGVLVGSADVMVRIRKDAMTLKPAERDRFVAALAQLNNQGAGRFVDFRDMHVRSNLAESHGAAGFLPWHRAYLLDFERELQLIDPSVSLPYWRFDQPAPNIFSPEFLGVTGPNGNVQFSTTNPLQFWNADVVVGIRRNPNFSTSAAPPGLRTESQTLAIGNLFRIFRTMEGNPHGSAHVSFDAFSSISNPATAPQDPLFFLLHCNVDRLWAKWQRNFARFDPSTAASYDSNPSNRVGHNLPDTMWPWNGVTGNPRPPTAPGGTLAASPSVSAPGAQPRVLDCLDYQGSINAISCMGFDYDDVAFS